MNHGKTRTSPHGLQLPVGDVKRRDSRHELHGCQKGVADNAENHLHPRYKQMKDIRPFEGTKAEQACDRLRDHTRLSILNWNAGLHRGNVTNRVVASHHVILLQEADSHFLEMAELTSTMARTSSFCSTKIRPSLVA